MSSQPPSHMAVLVVLMRKVYHLYWVCFASDTIRAMDPSLVCELKRFSVVDVLKGKVRYSKTLALAFAVKPSGLTTKLQQRICSPSFFVAGSEVRKETRDRGIEVTISHNFTL